jgi:hypothetical protein
MGQEPGNCQFVNLNGDGQGIATSQEILGSQGYIPINPKQSAHAGDAEDQTPERIEQVGVLSIVARRPGG